MLGIAVQVRVDLTLQAVNLRDANTGFIGQPCCHAVAGTGYRKTENVVADADVADGRRRKRSDESVVTHRIVPSPRNVASLRRSPKTPPAVTSGPAPGPWITSGLVE